MGYLVKRTCLVRRKTFSPVSKVVLGLCICIRRTSASSGRNECIIRPHRFDVSTVIRHVPDLQREHLWSDCQNTRWSTVVTYRHVTECDVLVIDCSKEMFSSIETGIEEGKQRLFCVRGTLHWMMSRKKYHLLVVENCQDINKDIKIRKRKSTIRDRICCRIRPRPFLECLIRKDEVENKGYWVFWNV